MRFLGGLLKFLAILILVAATAICVAVAAEADVEISVSVKSAVQPPVNSDSFSVNC